MGLAEVNVEFSNQVKLNRISALSANAEKPLNKSRVQERVRIFAQRDQRLIRLEYYAECIHQLWNQFPERCVWKYMETLKVWQKDKWRMDMTIPMVPSNSIEKRKQTRKQAVFGTTTIYLALNEKYKTLTPGLCWTVKVLHYMFTSDGTWQIFSVKWPICLSILFWFFSTSAFCSKQPSATSTLKVYYLIFICQSLAKIAT